MAQNGIVVTTFSGISFVNLHLESWRRNYPQLPLLVIDDGSEMAPLLEKLCSKYGAEFLGREKRFGHFTGDYISILDGLDWAKKNRLDYLIKLSRRFVPIQGDLVLEELVGKTAPTVGAPCEFYRHKLRTEAMALKVSAWHGVLDPELHPRLVEGVLEKKAEELGEIEWWESLGKAKKTKSPKYLWHNADSPIEYERLCYFWGLPYKADTFGNPDLTEGYVRYY